MQSPSDTSHLEEDRHKKKREAFLAKGLITEQDIVGNVAADKLAFLDADAHEKITDTITGMHDKLQFTVLIQKMLLNVWERFITEDEDCQQADQQDIEEFERMMINAQFEAQLDNDYDPFEDDNHAEHFPTNAASTIKSDVQELAHQKRRGMMKIWKHQTSMTIFNV